MNSIILFGFMGTGKSTVGRLLADRLNLPFLDMDEVIESKAGCTVAEIFERRGEAVFRKMEHALVRELSESKEPCVVATGGGVILNPKNLTLFRKIGHCVCLTASEACIYNRVRSHGQRPLLQHDDLKERIHRILSEREPLYAAVDIQIETGDQSAGVMADRILALINSRFA